MNHMQEMKHDPVVKSWKEGRISCPFMALPVSYCFKAVKVVSPFISGYI